MADLPAVPGRRLRVLVVTAWPPWLSPHGGSLVLAEQLRLLAPRHDITMLTCEPPPDGSVLPGVEVAHWESPLPRSVDYAVRRARGLLRREPAHVYYVERRGLLRRVRTEVAAGGPDIVHLHGWGTAQLAAEAGAIPTVHVPLDSWAIGAANRRVPRWRRVVDAGEQAAVDRHERRYYPRQGAVVVVTENDAADLRTRVPDARVEVVPNGVEPGPEPVPPADEPVLAFHGAYGVHANIDAALSFVTHVLPAVRRQLPEARALVIGADPPAELRSLAGPAVEVTGFVADVRTALSRAAVYVAPMVSGTGIKNKVLEAMAAGLPVVSTNLGLAGIGSGAGVVAADTPEEMAAAAVDLLRDPTARREAGRQARARVVRDFSWERSAGRVEALWLELARNRA